MPRGERRPKMLCPYCDHWDSVVVDARANPVYIRRRRECLACGRRFTTRERVERGGVAEKPQHIR